MKAIIPERNVFKPKYYQYIKYIENILRYNDVKIIKKGDVTGVTFNIILNDIKICFDYSDYHAIRNKEALKSGMPYFKFHWHSEEHKEFKNMYSWTGLSFYNWNRFYQFKKEINYKSNSNLIIHRDRMANQRRNSAQKILIDKYGKSVLTNRVSQEEYWKGLNDCLVYVHIPGCRKDSLDRSQKQIMAFGGCIITPIIDDYTAYNKRPIPNVHYLACKYDFSDLIDKIEWCKTHRKQCIEIGRNASRLFENTSTPKQIFNWLLKNIKEHNE